MRILLLNQSWFAEELRSFGHEVLSAGPGKHLDHNTSFSVLHIDELLQALPNGFKPDRIVWHDRSAPITVLGLEDCPIPSLMYSVDTHHHHQLHSCVADCFDYVCVAQKDYIHEFSPYNTPVSWLPLWAPELLEPSSDKTYGAVFVGTINQRLNPSRVAFFDRLKSLVDITVMQGDFRDIFTRAAIVVNQTVRGDLNFRVFESLMSGALLLTERIDNGLSELFQDGQHLVTYTPRDPLEAAEKIRELLNTPSKARQIAQNGRELCLARHRSIHRALELEAILSKLQTRSRPERRYLGALINALHIATLSMERNPGLSYQMLKSAIKYGEKALKNGTKPSSIEIPAIARAALRYDTLANDQLGSKLLHSYFEAYPDQAIFGLLCVRNLLNAGRIAESRALAQRLDAQAPHTQIFENAERLAQMLHADQRRPPTAESQKAT